MIHGDDKNIGKAKKTKNKQTLEERIRFAFA
jgi:hypothetical protein